LAGIDRKQEENYAKYKPLTGMSTFITYKVLFNVNNGSSLIERLRAGETSLIRAEIESRGKTANLLSNPEVQGSRIGLETGYPSYRVFL
jgi:hypothetical protein